MRHRKLMFILLSLILLLVSNDSLPAKSEKTDKAQEVLRQLENTWLESEDDPDALQSIFADDFIHVLPLGFVTKAEQLSYMRSHPAPKRGTKHFEDLRIRVFGNAGVVNGIVVASDADGTVRKTIFTDVFVYRKGK